MPFIFGIAETVLLLLRSVATPVIMHNTDDRRFLYVATYVSLAQIIIAIALMVVVI